MPKPKKHKVNPRRRPATAADVSRAERLAQEHAIDFTWSVFFTVLRDKYGWSAERLKECWEHISYLSDSYVKGYVTIDDLKTILEDEAGAVLARSKENE